MKTVIAIDSFKGSLSSLEAGKAAAEGIKRVFPDADTKVFAMADGGEGTVDAIISALSGRIRYVNVHDPLGRKVRAKYGIIPKTHTAVIEMAEAGGLTLVEEHLRDPMYTSTYGVGEMIADAIGAGCRDFIIGIGGSATNDGGSGMLSALGVRFLDKDGKEIMNGARGLEALYRIETENALKELRECRFSVACDVTNPLCGENGCSAVFAPQKGADAESVKLMDGYLARYAELTGKIFKDSDPEYPGSGAAGGLGFAFRSYLGAKLRRGIDIVTEAINIEEAIASADIVITGEGRLDAQTCMGKAPAGIAKLAKKHGKTVIAFAGAIADGASDCNENGIDAFFPILKAPCSLAEAMDAENARKNLADTAEQVFRLLKL